VVREFDGIVVEGDFLRIGLRSNRTLPALLSGVRLVAEEPTSTASASDSY
jgi:hypothetical protein